LTTVNIAQQAETTLGEVWRSLMDDHSPLKVAFCKTFVEAYERAGILTTECAELWRLRMEYECPEGKGNHIGGRAWCGFCGDTPERFEERAS
jgi:hypothetical protein